MTLNRREFMAGAVACAGTLCSGGCAEINPVPTVEASADGRFAVPPELAEAGGQIKARLPGAQDLVLVWRTPQGFGAASIACTHRGSEVHFNATQGTLDCPSHGSRFAQDGKVLHGPAKNPLASYTVVADGTHLKIRPS